MDPSIQISVQGSKQQHQNFTTNYPFPTSPEAEVDGFHMSNSRRRACGTRRGLSWSSTKATAHKDYTARSLRLPKAVSTHICEDRQSR